MIKWLLLGFLVTGAANTLAQTPVAEPTPSQNAPVPPKYEEIQRQMQEMRGRMGLSDEQIQKMQSQYQFLTSQKTQKIIQILTDDRIVKPLMQLMARGEFVRLLLMQAIAFVLIVLLKTWGSSNLRHWLDKFIFDIIAYLITLITLGFIVPLIHFGDNYWFLLKGMYQIIIEMLK